MDDIKAAFERIKARVLKQENGCWNWPGSIDKDMYGSIRVGAKVMSTHRAAYLCVHGLIARGKVIRHTCDNRACCNPDHLLVGDHEDNNQDIVDRGRGMARRILSEEERAQVVAMRKGGATKRAIAQALHCNWAIVSRVIDLTMVDAPKRPGRPRGSRNLHTRVTDADKAQIRALYATGQHTQQALAEKFGCDQTYVSLIVRGLK